MAVSSLGGRRFATPLVSDGARSADDLDEPAVRTLAASPDTASVIDSSRSDQLDAKRRCCLGRLCRARVAVPLPGRPAAGPVSCVEDMSATQETRSACRNGPRLEITTNNLAKRIKRVALGLTNFRHHRVRCLLYAGRPDWTLLPTIQP